MCVFRRHHHRRVKHPVCKGKNIYYSFRFGNKHHQNFHQPPTINHRPPHYKFRAVVTPRFGSPCQQHKEEGAETVKVLRDSLIEFWKSDKSEHGGVDTLGLALPPPPAHPLLLVLYCTLCNKLWRDGGGM